MSRHFVTDDPDTFGRKESDIESTFTSPPHALFRRRHIDHRNHITHLHSDAKRNNKQHNDIVKHNDTISTSDTKRKDRRRPTLSRDWAFVSLFFWSFFLKPNIFFSFSKHKRRIAWLLLLFHRLASDYTVQICVGASKREVAPAAVCSDKKKKKIEPVGEGIMICKNRLRIFFLLFFLKEKQNKTKNNNNKFLYEKRKRKENRQNNGPRHPSVSI